MIIHKISLKNFGRLDDFSAEMTGNTVGLEGKNGRGKSTVLQAIRYALTGTLDDTASSYMRDGGKHGKTSVEMEFTQKGVQGRIVRSITASSSSRKLYLDGATDPITTAKEVDLKMQELLGADQRAIAGCVFVPQGKIDEVLFGDNTEREDRFQRMLGMSHYSNIVRAVDAQIGVLNSGVADLSAAKQELENQTAVIRQQLLDEADVSTAHFVKPDTAETLKSMQASLDVLHKIKDDVPNLMRLSELVGALAPKKKIAEERLTTLGALIAGKKSEAASRTAQRSVCLDWLEANKLFEKASDEIRLSQSSYQSKLVALTGLQPVSEEDVAKLRTLYTGQQSRAQAIAQKLQWTIELQALQQALEREQITANTAKAEAETANKSHVELVERLQPELHSLSQQKSSLVYRSTVLSTACSWDASSTSHSCPVCASPMTTDKAQMRSWLMEVTKSIEELTAQQKQLEAQVTTSQVKLQDCKRVEDQYARALTIATAARDAKLSLIPEPLQAIGDLETELATWNALVAETLARGTQLSAACNAYNAEVAAVKAAEAEVNVKQASYMGSCSRLKAATESLTRVTGLQSVSPGSPLLQTSTADAEISKLESEQKTLESVIAEHNQATASYAAAYQNWVRLAAQFSLTQWDAATATFVDAKIAETTETHTATTARLEAYKASQSKITLLQEQQKQVGARMAALMEREREQAQTKGLIAQLMEVRRAFDKTGIPREFLRDTYAVVLNAMNVHLSAMGAPLEVRCAEKPMSFEFRRTDEESTWLDQCKLSGGQKVRASVAFLLTLQSLIIPEVGLLVLDEPSMHLDEESQEGLRDLLLGMRPTLASAEKQIIVCDHCPTLMPAFERRLVL